MSARVESNGEGARHPWNAWCDSCQDGVNGTARKANNWANTHNQKHHTPETETTP